MIQFYSPFIENSRKLTPEDSAHAVRVLRKKEGDEITVTDGKGKRFFCHILSADPRELSLVVDRVEIIPKSWDVEITLALAPTKNADRMEWLVEKAVEIGIDRIVMIKCARSERKILKTERLRKIAVSAMKQSLKTFLPDISEIIGFREFMNKLPAGEKYMGYCDKHYPLKEFIGEYSPGSSVVLLIGPEGDFSPEEVDLAVDNGFIPVSFTDSRLRTETAALYGVEAIHVINRFCMLQDCC